MDNKRKRKKKQKFSDDEWVEKPVVKMGSTNKNSQKNDEFDFLFGNIETSKCEAIITPHSDREINKAIFDDKDYNEQLEMNRINNERKNIPWKERMASRMSEGQKSMLDDRDVYKNSLLQRKDFNTSTEKSFDIYDSLNEMIKEEKLVKNQDIIYLFKLAYSAIGNVKSLHDRFRSDSRKLVNSKASKLKKSNEVKIDDCPYCNLTDEYVGKFVINQTDKLMIVVPPFRTVIDTEFYIIPIEHHPDSTQLEKETLTKIHNFFDRLIKQLKKSGKSAVFIETFHDSAKRGHMIIDCFIFDLSDVSDLKIYFKKAIMESDVEWSNHKKLMTFKGTKFYEKIPAGFPYISVIFGTDESYVHIIEDSRRVPKNFGLEIIGGYLDADQTIWLYQKHDTEESVKKRAKILLDILYDIEL